MGFLWANARFRITSSSVATSNGGDARIVLESSSLTLVITCDRRQLALKLGPARKSAGDNIPLYSIDLFKRLLTGERDWKPVLDADDALFVENYLDQVEEALDPEHIAVTEIRMKDLKKQRAKEMFG